MCVNWAAKVPTDVVVDSVPLVVHLSMCDC